MGKDTTIAWTKSTRNLWIGCTEVGPGCDHCYAKKMDARRVYGGTTHWGPGVPRYRTTFEPLAEELRAWNRRAPESEFAGHRGFWPVFLDSMSDFFDNEVPESWRADAWALIRECSNLTFILVTKRIGNAKSMLPPDWGDGYPNVIIVATVVNQAEADRDVPKLLALPARRRGLSIEPMLGPIDLVQAGAVWHEVGNPDPIGRIINQREAAAVYDDEPTIDWVIVGGESGHRARPMHPDWPRSIRRQCAAAGVAFFFKQWGEWAADQGSPTAHVKPKPWNAKVWPDMTVQWRAGTKAAGRLLDGIEHNDFPLEIAHA